MGEVRKLQKKLRQIENLEIKASLTTEERVKVSKKAELRARLAELLLQHCGPQQPQSIVGDESEKMKRQVPEVSSVPSPAPKVPRTATPETGTGTGTGTGAGQGKGKGDSEEDADPQDNPAAPTETASPLQQKESEFSSLKASWEATKFRLRTLEGHSDIITCVVAVDNLVISGSRDTTVKVWHVPTATEQRNLGGHSGGVTCLGVPPPEYCRRMARFLDLSEKERFILSGASDCCVRVWVLSTGQCVKSIYTFNAVTALCFVPEGPGYIITGSDGGKVQTWSWQSMENCQSVNAHREAVTALQALCQFGLQSQGPLVFSGSADGGVCVWEVHPSQHHTPLHRLQDWGPSVTGCGGGAHLALSPRGDRVFMACGRASVRVLDWRTGSVSRVTNHSSTAGVTDCINQLSGLLIGSCFDLATGGSTLNLFTLPQCRYLVSLVLPPDTPRILCFAAWRTASGDHRWVTGGRELTVWEQLPSKTKHKGDVLVRRDCRLDTSLVESEEDSEGDVEESDGYSEEDSLPGDVVDVEGVVVSGSSWLRCVLQ